MDGAVEWVMRLYAVGNWTPGQPDPAGYWPNPGPSYTVGFKG